MLDNVNSPVVLELRMGDYVKLAYISRNNLQGFVVLLPAPSLLRFSTQVDKRGVWVISRISVTVAEANVILEIGLLCSVCVAIWVLAKCSPLQILSRWRCIHEC